LPRDAILRRSRRGSGRLLDRSIHRLIGRADAPVIGPRKCWGGWTGRLLRGGRAAAVLYTLIECCKLAGVDVLAYLADVLVRVATHPASRIDELLPANWAKHFAVTASA
jgi:hypothetical protein